MKRLCILSRLSLLVMTALVTGCGSSQTTTSSSSSTSSASETPGPKAAAAPVQPATPLDPVKQLAGTWEMKGPDGSVQTIVYSVGSGGSAVREIMFPGHPHEMTNMYHMDGNSVVMTHYCAAGNQPRMRATPGTPGVLDFKADSVTNLASSDTHYMGGLRLVFVDKDHVREEWKSVENGKVSDGPVFELTRKK
ncbi:MAG: hypothetical protein H7210_12720 [Pyrinomonadaceae bacterium]|nr:hypothetical protein [Phycisphaerales bacterium]